MTALSNQDIANEVAKGNLVISPFTARQLQPASYDVRLGAGIVQFSAGDGIVDPLDPEIVRDGERYSEISCGGSWILEPNEFVLGCTVEAIRLPSYMCARFEGRSSLGRLGLLTHCTAGFIDPGFHGTITVECKNVFVRPLRMTPGMSIGQISFMYLRTPADPVYGSSRLKSKYQGQVWPQISLGVGRTA